MNPNISKKKSLFWLLWKSTWNRKETVIKNTAQFDLYYTTCDKTGTFGCGFAICGAMGDQLIACAPSEPKIF